MAAPTASVTKPGLITRIAAANSRARSHITTGFRKYPCSELGTASPAIGGFPAAGGGC